MRLLEYEAKLLLEKSGLTLAHGTLIHRGEPIPALNLPVVLKSQVPVGGRGKAGGIITVDDQLDMSPTVQSLFALEIKGHTPHTLLAEKQIPIASERYLSILVNRETASIQLMAHVSGGIEVEGNESGFYITDITPETINAVAEHVAKLFNENNAGKITPIITNLYDCFVQNDALLIEINPLVKTTDGTYVCADAKIELDDAARFRHPEWDFEDKPHDANFVTLDPHGEIATIANGAGLAMATVDAVASYGMKPANFLDIGGGANKDSILRAFNRIMEYAQVRAIVINIFAGITRCDEVARAVIAARSEIDNLPPLFIRLAGTNFEAAVKILSKEHIPTLASLEACLESAKESLDA